MKQVHVALEGERNNMFSIQEVTQFHLDAVEKLNMSLAWLVLNEQKYTMLLCNSGCGRSLKHFVLVVSVVSTQRHASVFRGGSSSS